MRLLLRLSAAIDRIVTAIGMAGGWIAVPLMAVILYDVVGRRFFNTGSMMIQDLEWHLHGVLFLSAFGFAYLKDAHVRIELLRDGWKVRRRAAIEIAGVVFFIIPLCLLMILHGYDFAERAFLRNEGAPGGVGLPNRWVIKSFLAFGFSVLLLAACSVLIKCVAVLTHPASLGREGAAWLMGEGADPDQIERT
ncbi:MAG: TRAP transporter small permease subunit [Alphaproteobacteria bacterium]|nr:TRAP transporter small permease subunit [Alphaproteobacteria bacterium]